MFAALQVCNVGEVLGLSVVLGLLFAHGVCGMFCLIMLSVVRDSSGVCFLCKWWGGLTV